MLFLTTLLATQVWGQKGSVIVIQTKGLVEAISPTGSKLKEPVVRGSVLPEGYSIKTNLFSESVLLLSNGTTATIQENSVFKLIEFKQAPFDAQNQSFGQLENEPSTSTVSIEMEIGSLVVQTKKLNKTSSFSIQTPTGTAVIRGTQFQLASSPNTGMQLDVAESQVAFTPAGQNKPIVVGHGRGLDSTPSGQIKQRPINPIVSQNISAKNSVASTFCAAVPISTSQEANTKTETSSGVQDSDDSNSENENQIDSQEESEDKQTNSNVNKAAESFLGRSNSVSKRLIDGSEIQNRQESINQAIDKYLDLLAKENPNISREVLKQSLISAVDDSSLIDDIVNSVASENPENVINSSIFDLVEDAVGVPSNPIPSPPNITPPSPPTSSIGIGNSVLYDYDAEENVISIGLYEGEFPIPVEVSFLNIEDLEGENSFAEILSKFQKWDTNDETKLINAIGLEVFIEEIGLNPYKYDNFNVAIQNAVILASSFLETVTLASTIPSGSVRNVSGLIDQFSNNPYAFEFAKLLAKHGAISNPSNQTTTDNLLAILGSEKLSDPNYLSTLLNQTLNPGKIYNSEELNGALIGARNASIDEDTAEKLQIRLDHVDALVGGDIFIEQGASIDVSPYLTAKGENKHTKIFTIAAAKDLSIWGDVTFENDNHAEDHALAIGSAGDLNIQAGSSIYYEGTNLGLGTAGDLRLENVEIDVGGNLAIGSLGDLDIEFTEPGSKLFSVGRYSDRDNIYLYANDLIRAQGLRFNDRAREIYMDAITVNLKDVEFPQHSEVMLRSQKGTLDFGTFENPTIGGVNLTQVKHLGISQDRALEQSDFSGSTGKWNTTVTHTNGAPALRVRAFSNANADNGLN